MTTWLDIRGRSKFMRLFSLLAQVRCWLLLGSLCAIISLNSGCTYLASKSTRLNKSMTEAGRMNNTAAAEALNTQPSTNRDAHTEIARLFVEQNRRVLGEPAKPFAVLPLIQSNAQAQVSLQHQFDDQNKVVAQERKTQEKLLDYGVKYEEARNARISWWTKWISIFGGTIGGIIALCVFVPVVIPLLFRLLTWVVGKIPTIGSWLGVVGYDAYKRAVVGIQECKAHFETTGDPATLSVLRKISKDNTYPDAALVEHVKQKECYTPPPK